MHGIKFRNPYIYNIYKLVGILNYCNASYYIKFKILYNLVEIIHRVARHRLAT